MVDLFGSRPISAGFQQIKWSELAHAFGWGFCYIDNAPALQRLFPAILGVSRPTLVEIVVSEDELAPDYINTLRRKGRR
jgi:thiamine pyrophosphate-dependent acetolactate synthase large subunit-like protein